MSETQHTPGPWNQLVQMEGYTAVGADTLIARVYSRAFRDIENELANARLIAAAPDLLEALREMLTAVEMDGANGLRFHEARNGGLAAIAKAEGRP